MTTFTKEQLIEKAREQIAFCRHTKITGEGRTHVNQCSALFEIALASLDAEPAPAQPVIQEQIKYQQLRDIVLLTANNLIQSGYSPKENSLHPWESLLFEAEKALAAQLVSEPYKLKDAVADIRNSGVEIDADKIKSERDALNYPVIPDAYVLDELGRMTLNGVCEPRVSFGSGWNACRAEMLKTQQNEPQNIPENIPAQPVSEHKPYAWAIEHKVGLPTVVFNKPNTNSWAFKDAVIKELYEAPALESE